MTAQRSTAMTDAETGATSTVEYESVMHDALAADCTFERLTAAQLGLSVADESALATPRSVGLWRFDGTTLTPVELPDPAAEGPASRTACRTDALVGRRTWVVGDDGSFTEVFAGWRTGRGPGPVCTTASPRSARSM